jgi:hypothetical protein
MKEGSDAIKDLKINDRHEGITKEMMAQEVAASAPIVMPIDHTLEDFCFQVYIEVSLIQHDKVLEPKLFTGVKYFYELKEVLTFPLKYKDLSPISRLAIQIFSFDSPNMDTPIASTVVDLFDSKRRLRQGTWNLQLHRDKVVDPSLDS